MVCQRQLEPPVTGVSFQLGFAPDNREALQAALKRDNATEQLTRTAVRFHEESEFYDRMRGKVSGRGWDRCARIATQKRMLKLNLTYRALRSVAQLQLGDAMRGLKLLREIWT